MQNKWIRLLLCFFTFPLYHNGVCKLLKKYPNTKMLRRKTIKWLQYKLESYTVTVVADAAALPLMLIELLLGSCGAATLLFLAFSLASSFSKVSGFLSLASRLTSLSGVCDRLLPEIDSKVLRSLNGTQWHNSEKFRKKYMDPFWSKHWYCTYIISWECCPTYHKHVNIHGWSKAIHIIMVFEKKY